MLATNQDELYLRSSTASPIKKSYNRVEDIRATTTSHTLRNEGAQGAIGDGMYAEDNESGFANIAYKPVKHNAFENTKPASRSKKDQEQRDMLRQSQSEQKKLLLKEQQRQRQQQIYLEQSEQTIQMRRQDAAIKQRQRQAVEGEQMYDKMMILALQQKVESSDVSNNNKNNVNERTQRGEKAKKEEEKKMAEGSVLLNNKEMGRPQSRKLYLGTSAGSNRESSSPATTDLNSVRTYYYGTDTKKDDILPSSDSFMPVAVASAAGSKPGTANNLLARPSKSAGAVRKGKGNKPTLQRMSSFGGFDLADTSDKDDDASMTVDGRPPSRQSSAFPFHLSQSNGEQTPPNETGPAISIGKMDRNIYSPLIHVGRRGMLNTASSRSDLDDSQDSDMKPVDLVDLDSDDEIIQTKPKSRQSKSRGKGTGVVGDGYNNGYSLFNAATNDEVIGQRGGTSHSSSTNTTELTSSSSDLGNSGKINQNLNIAAGKGSYNKGIRDWVADQPIITPSNVSKDLMKDGFLQLTPPSTSDRDKVPFKIHVTYSNRHSSGKKSNKSKSRDVETEPIGQHAHTNTTKSIQIMGGKSTKGLIAVRSAPYGEKMVSELRDTSITSYTTRIVDQKTNGNKNNTTNGNITTIPTKSNNSAVENSHSHDTQETQRVLLQSKSMVDKGRIDRNEDSTDIEDDFIVVSYDDDDDDDIINDDDDNEDSDELLSDSNHGENRMFNARANKHGEVNTVFRTGCLDENGREEIIDLENLDLGGDDFVTSLEDDFLSLFHT